MKIIHLSDTHVGHGHNEQRLGRIIEDILSLGPPRDHVVVHTGDLIDQGTVAQMALARPLLERLSGQGWRVLLSPGNHDYGNAIKVDKQWAKNFETHFRPYLFTGDQSAFPVLTVIGGCAFIGLDSNAGEMNFRERWMAEGSLGEPQIAALEALLDALRGKTIVVYLHHHPFQDAYAVDPEPGQRGYLSHCLGLNTRRFRRLKDAYALLQVLRDRADILLFGHQHFGLDYSAEGRRYGISMALDASSSTRAREPQANGFPAIRGRADLPLTGSGNGSNLTSPPSPGFRADGID